MWLQFNWEDPHHTDLSRAARPHLRCDSPGRSQCSNATAHMGGISILYRYLSRNSRWTHWTHRGCIQKFPDWPSGERTAKRTPLSATRCSCIAILWVRLASFAATTLSVASQRVFMVVVVVYFVIDSFRKLLDTPSYTLNLEVFLHMHQVISLM